MENVELHIATNPFMVGQSRKRRWTPDSRISCTRTHIFNNNAILISSPYIQETEFDWPSRIRKGIKQKCGLESMEWENMPKIFVNALYIRDEVYPRLYRGADALVIPTRGEGWGRPQMEAVGTVLTYGDV